jgi:hypothetical protein
MDNQLQYQYLQTLGISQYVPRDVVYEDIAVEKSGRAVAKIDVQTPSAEPVAKVAKKPVDVAALVNLGLDDNTVGKTGSKKNSRTTPKVAVSKPSLTEDTPQTAIEVSFSFWQASEELLVCSAVEGALADTEQMQLLTNILNAIGCGINRLPQMDLIEWPPYPNASGDETEVREFLGTLLNARLAKKPVKSILLLGEGAANWLISPDLQQQKETGQVAISAQTTALLLPSLSSMIENPQQKAVAWKLLQLLLPQSS